MNHGWIGVDLDGTLAHYDGWKGIEHIGEPIPAMVERIQKWLDDGQKVKIFTARVWSDGSTARERETYLATKYIHSWCLQYIGTVLPVTCQKDFGMIELWDDRAVRVKINTGMPCCGEGDV